MDPIPQQVTSERLAIRPTRRSDAEHLKKWWNDSRLTASEGHLAGMQYDDDDMEDWFARYVDGRDCHTHFIITLRDTGQPIGEFYIASDDRPGSVGLALIIGEVEQWGQGYASEALGAYVGALFGDDHCEVIRVDVNAEDSRAVRMCEKVGFEVEHVWANGRFQTMIMTADDRDPQQPRGDR